MLILFWTKCLFKKYFIYLFPDKGREKKWQGNITVWLPLMCPQLGFWSATQVGALTGDQNGDRLVCRLGWCSIHWATPTRAKCFFTSIKNKKNEFSFYFHLLINWSFFFFSCWSRFLSLIIFFSLKNFF